MEFLNTINKKVKKKMENWGKDKNRQIRKTTIMAKKHRVSKECLFT